MEPTTRRARWWIAPLLVANVAVAAEAAGRGDLGATHGPALAGTTGVALGLALVLGRLPAGPAVVTGGRVLVLGTQALHGLGHLRGLYALPLYDDVLHLAAGAGVALVLLAWARRDRHLAPARIGVSRAAALLVVATLAVAAVWELWEFASDRALGTREQDDLADTMQDVADGLAGAALVAAGYAAGARLQRRAARPRSESAPKATRSRT